MELFSFISPEELTALITVILTDIVLAGDNAIVVGMAAAGLPAEQRRKAIMIGIVGATLMRIGFAVVTTQLLQIIGLLLAGGLLLLWVCWKLYRELRADHGDEAAAIDAEILAAGQRPKRMKDAVTQIMIADLSMSLDNVLAVAGAAREHTWVLIIGLALSVALMGLAASLMARILVRHRWIGYIGLLVILYISLGMIWEGFGEVLAAIE